jgi:hypothetical protein
MAELFRYVWPLMSQLPARISGVCNAMFIVTDCPAIQQIMLAKNQ